MSDATDLFHGKFGTGLPAVVAFAEKEWHNLEHLIAGLPADIQPLAVDAVAKLQTVIADGVEWGGTAVEAYIAAHTDDLKTFIANLFSGATGGAAVTGAAGQDAVRAFSAVLLALVSHVVLDLVNAVSPQAPAQPSS